MKMFKSSYLRRSRFLKTAGFLNLGIIGCKTFLAGGALRTLINNDEEVADFDVFFEDAPEEVIDGVITKHTRCEEIKEILLSERFKQVFVCPKGELFTFKKDDIKVQLILSTTGTPETVISAFDFGACRVAFDGVFLYFDKEFVRDVRTKVLSVQNVTFPAATIKRMMKYKDKGYNVSQAAVQFMEHVSGKTWDGDQLRLYVD